MLTVKLFSPWHTEDLVFGNVRFSPGIDIDAADAALWEYWPNERIFEYNRPKAWYSWEPKWHSMHRSRLVRRARRVLRDDEWLYYAHADPALRVPHITNCGGHDFHWNAERLPEAVALVSHFGGRFWPLRPGTRYRNRFVTHPSVALYGRLSSWQTFRRWGVLRRGPPRNYRGEANWKNAWMSEEQVEFTSRFKAAVCLENNCEPFYFTEKFYNAARAGCVPVYRAHPTVRDGILRGAAWIDPGDYGGNVAETVKAALCAPLKDFQERNFLWLQKADVRATEFDGVWQRLAEIFEHKARTASVA
jgi:hypothetical protein